MKSQRRHLLVIAIVLAIYAVMGAVWLPHYLRSHIALWVKQVAPVELQVDAIRCNPFTLNLEVEQLNLRDEQQHSLLQLPFARINLSWASVFTLSPRFDAIELRQLSLHLTELNDGQMNWQKVLPTNQSAADDSATPNFYIADFQLQNASVFYRNEQHTPAIERSVTPINLQLADFSSQANALGDYQLLAKLADQSSWQWQGQIGLQPLRSQGSLTITHLQLSTVAPFITALQQFTTTDATISGALNYQFVVQDERPQWQVPSLQITVEKLQLQHRDDQTPALTAQQWHLSAQIDGAKRQIKVNQMHLNGTQIRARTLATGDIDWVTRTSNDTAAENNQEQSLPWTIDIDDLNLKQWQLHYRDDARVLPWTADIAELNWQTSAHFELGDQLDYHVENGQLNLRNVTWQSVSDEQRLMQLSRMDISNLNIDQASKKIQAGDLSLQINDTIFWRDNQQNIVQLKALQSRLPDQGEKPWHIEAAQLTLQMSAIEWRDQSLTPQFEFPLTAVTLQIAPFSPSRDQLFKSTVAITFPNQGMAHISSNNHWQTLAGSTEFDVQHLPLTAMTPYLQQQAHLHITEGDLSLKGQAKFTPTKNTMAINAQLDAEVQRFALAEKPSGDSLFSVQKLRVDRIRYDSKKAQLQIADMRAEQPFATVHVFSDKHTNLDDLMVKPAQSSPPSTVTTLKINADRFRVQNGVLDFRDDSLVLPFATRVTEFGGSITEISNASEARANVALNGAINQYGAATINGSLRAFEPLAFTDLRAQFQNVELNPMSAYSATFAGRKIDQGRLSLDLRYLIQNRVLQGENKITLDQFELGEDVDSKSAVWLPLDLALAILRDSDGRIQVEVPVSGQVDDPEFGYGKVVWQALVNVVSKIATAPFRALASLFGDDSESLDALQFDFGRAYLAPPQREKLDRVIKGLQTKPNLILQISAQADPQRDKRALAQATIQRQILSTLGVPVAPNDEPSPLAFEQAKTQLALEQLAEQQWSSDMWQHYQQNSDAKKRVNRTLALLNSGAGDETMYRELFALLIERWSVSDEAISQLAQQRAEAVASYVTQQGLASTQQQIVLAKASSDDRYNALLALSIDAKRKAN